MAFFNDLLVNDGGKDIIAHKDGKKHIIECKRYSEDNTVGRPLLQKFSAVVRDENAALGLFVTTSYFSSGAIEYAKRVGIELIDRKRLTELINETFPPKPSDNAYELMCPECGDKVASVLTVVSDRKQCPKGHPVELIKIAELDR